MGCPALKLDPSVSIKRVLVNKTLVTRAERAYNEMYWKTERELGKDKSPNEQKKKKSWRSAARPAGPASSLLERIQLPPAGMGYRSSAMGSCVAQVARCACGQQEDCCLRKVASLDSRRRTQ